MYAIDKKGGPAVRKTHREAHFRELGPVFPQPLLEGTKRIALPVNIRASAHYDRLMKRKLNEYLCNLC